jgi:fructose-bisphosphate aldolase class II
MSFVAMKPLLESAMRNKYAVGAFNVTNLEFLEALLYAAEQSRSPIILNIAEVHFRYIDLFAMSRIIEAAAIRATIPVCLNLDHGINFDAVVKAIRCGFSSVMFDGSTLPLEENIKRTGEIVKIAHSVGVSVEAELGHVGGGEGSRTGTAVARDLFTRPDEAEKFVNETGVDALAIAFGSVHGRFKESPNLDFELLGEIRNRICIPLVLHGGSGISDEDFRKAISLGICKINIFTEMTISATDAIKKTIKDDPEIISFPDLAQVAKEAVVKVAMDKMDTFGSRGRCNVNQVLCPECRSYTGFPPEDAPKPDESNLGKMVDSIVSKVLKELNKN